MSPMPFPMPAKDKPEAEPALPDVTIIVTIPGKTANILREMQALADEVRAIGEKVGAATASNPLDGGRRNSFAGLIEDVAAAMQETISAALIDYVKNVRIP